MIKDMMAPFDYLGLFIVTGAATLIGSVPVFLHARLRQGHLDWMDNFGAGVMCGASLFSLYWPAFELLGGFSPLLLPTFTGLFFIWVSSKLLALITKNSLHHRAFLIVLVMALHNIPEGLAVGFNAAGLGWSQALKLNVAIFVQNLPEGFVTSMSFLLAGLGMRLALLASAMTALFEYGAALSGFAFTKNADSDLGIMLAFAGSSMLCVVLMEFLRRAKEKRGARLSWSGFIIGFLLTAVLDFL
jgi:zinc transporter, ZIP family